MNKLMLLCGALLLGTNLSLAATVDGDNLADYYNKQSQAYGQQLQQSKQQQLQQQMQQLPSQQPAPNNMPYSIQGINGGTPLQRISPTGQALGQQPTLGASQNNNTSATTPTEAPVPTTNTNTNTNTASPPGINPGFMGNTGSAKGNTGDFMIQY